MDWLQMEHGVLDKYIWTPCLHSQDYHQADGNGPAQIIMGKAQPLEDWCWVFSVVHAQMGSRSYIELWVRRSRTNCRPYYPDMPNTSGTHRNSWSDSFGWCHTMLAKCHHCQHLIKATGQHFMDSCLPLSGYPSKRIKSSSSISDVDMELELALKKVTLAQAPSILNRAPAPP